MNFVNVFVSIMILFVAINLSIAVYRLLNRKWREGLENAQDECPGSYCLTYKNPPVCHGSNTPCNPAASSVAAVAPVVAAVAAAPAAVAPAAVAAVAPAPVAAVAPAAVAPASVVQPTASASLADGARKAGVMDGTINTPNRSISTDPTVVSSNGCDVLAIHNNSAHNSTYGRWFPANIQKLNLSSHDYEHAGRKFLNEESVKKGVSTPLTMASEAQVLGRLLWKVHLAAITQVCMHNSAGSVATTMKDELALMKKVHKIQSAPAESSVSGCAREVNSCTHPKQTTNCHTTGMMQQNPVAYPTMTNSINSQVPSMTKGTFAGYSNDYKPVNPNKNPQPYNSAWDVF